MARHPLQAVLQEQGRNQRWLARRIGVSEFQLSRMLNGHLPTNEAVERACAEVLGVPVSLLFPHVHDVPIGTDVAPCGDRPDAA